MIIHILFFLITALSVENSSLRAVEERGQVCTGGFEDVIYEVTVFPGTNLILGPEDISNALRVSLSIITSWS